MHLPYIQGIEIARPPELGGGTWCLSRLGTVAVLFGKNGSGKSKLLRSWRDAYESESHYVVPERAGEIDYHAGYTSEQQDARGRKNSTQRNFSGEYRRHVVARIQSYFAARGDHRGDTLPTRPEELEALLAPLLPDFTLTLSGSSVPPYKLERLAGGQVQNIDQLSSGETQVLTLALDILTVAGIWDIQNPKRRFMLVDEPDAHIHPDLQVRFADFLVAVSIRFKLQVVVATHSTALLAALGHFAGSDACVLYLDRDKTDFEARPFDEELSELSACLGGHALMGPLFGAPLLLVEGDDDYRIWSQVPRYHHVNFATIPTSGGDHMRRYQKSLEKVMAALRDKSTTDSGYALLDADKPKPVASDSLPQNHVRYIQLACHEAENLYVSDEALALMGADWPTIQSKILSRADSWGPKNAELRAFAGADRKSADIKNLIRELEEIIDPKKVMWTMRVAQALGKERPQGQLADFLSEETVVAIWGVLPTPKTPIEAETKAE